MKRYKFDFLSRSFLKRGILLLFTFPKWMLSNLGAKTFSAPTKVFYDSSGGFLRMEIFSRACYAPGWGGRRHEQFYHLVTDGLRSMGVRRNTSQRDC